MRKPSDIRAFEEMLAAGPLTLVIIYADWCGYCQRRKDEFNSLMNQAGPGMNVAKLNETMMPQTSVADAKISGYPSVILVGNDKKPASFTEEDGSMTNALPKSDKESLEQIISTANSGSGSGSGSFAGVKNSLALGASGTKANSLGLGLGSSKNTNNLNLGVSGTNSLNLKTPSLNMNRTLSNQANIEPVSSNLMPSSSSSSSSSSQPFPSSPQPPNVLEDMVSSQKKTPMMGGASAAAYKPGLFKELEMMAKNGRWLAGRVMNIARRKTARKSKKSKRN